MDKWFDWGYWRKARGPISANSMKVTHAEVFNLEPDGSLTSEYFDSTEGHHWNGATCVPLPQ